MMRRVRHQAQESEPGPAGSHETALKKFLSVSELVLDREMAATYILGPCPLDAETDTLFREGEPVSLGHRAVALLRVLVEQRGIPVGWLISPNVGWLLISTTTSMYLIYEFMHFCCHVDEN